MCLDTSWSIWTPNAFQSLIQGFDFFQFTSWIGFVRSEQMPKFTLLQVEAECVLLPVIQLQEKCCFQSSRRFQLLEIFTLPVSSVSPAMVIEAVATSAWAEQLQFWVYLGIQEGWQSQDCCFSVQTTSRLWRPFTASSRPSHSTLHLNSPKTKRNQTSFGKGVIP